MERPSADGAAPDPCGGLPGRTIPAMKTGRHSPNRMNVWGDSLLNKLPSLSRKRRKRAASKIRRRRLRDELDRESPPAR